MKLYSSVLKIVLTDNLIEKARQFADAVTLTTNYSDANQTKIDKIKKDHFVSKLGEEAAAFVLSQYAKVEGPDYTIYQAKEKSWQADLFVNEIPVAVKSQTTSAAIRYGLSWTFQAGIKRKDIILQQPEKWVCFVEYDDYHSPYQTCFVLPPFQVKELVFDEPKLAYLKDHKKVVYANSLPRMQVEELFQKPTS